MFLSIPHPYPSELSKSEFLARQPPLGRPYHYRRSSGERDKADRGAAIVPVAKQITALAG
jgi:hypothetical protein